MPNRPPSCSKLPIDSACHGLAHIPWRGAFVGSLPYPVPICCWDGLQCCHHHKPEQEDLCLLCLAAKFHHRLATQKQRLDPGLYMRYYSITGGTEMQGTQVSEGKQTDPHTRTTSICVTYLGMWGEMCRNTSITQDCQFTWTAQMQNAFP